MIPIDLSGKVALVTGVGDNESFAWFIAKALNAAGCRLLFGVHPRMKGIVDSILERDADADTRVLPDGASAISLTYLGGERVVPHYGGGMSTGKAALQLDTKVLAQNLGPKKIRVNTISAGPYASRAARAIGDIDQMIKYQADRSPLQR